MALAAVGWLALVTLVTGVHPYDRMTWILEVFPILIVAPLLVATRRSFPLTPLLYALVALHGTILAVGGHWTYARVPLGFWMEDWFGFARNHYDRIGHLAQGFIPAVAAREVLVRRTPLGRGGWLAFLTLAVCLAVSAVYELIEWLAAVVSGEAATAFLGTQGDVWDTQWDMFLCGVGATLSLLLLSRWHDRQLARFGV